MKKIKIFIGSSVDKREFELEREKLGSFINGLNRQLIDRGIYVDFYDCETVSNKMTAEGSQRQHDDYIEKEADATFFMFFKKAGEFTLHELEIAHKTLLAQKRPDIFTYFKVVGDDIEETEQIKKAVDVIANSYGHYFSKFSDVDTIKLGMLQYITERLNDGSEVTLNKGTICINDMPIDGISLENIFAYQNNREYKRLLSEVKDLDEKINAAIEEKDFDSLEKYTNEKGEAEKTLSKLETDILNMLIDMQRELKKDDADPMRMKAYQLLEAGKIKEAQKLFPLEVLESKANNLLLKKELAKREHEELVENAKVRIKALSLDTSNKNRFSEIEKTYISVLESAIFVEDVDFVYEYAVFLKGQNKIKEAYKAGKRLEGLILVNPEITDELNKSVIYDFLGCLCNEIPSKKEEAENYYLASINAKEKLAAEDPELVADKLATAYNNLGLFYQRQCEPEKAEGYYLAAINAREKLAAEHPERYDSDLAGNYNNAGAFYCYQNNPAKAEGFFLSAIKIQERLAAKDPESFEGDLAMSYYNFGIFYDNLNDTQKAESYYLAAIKACEELAVKNPARFEPNLAMCYGNAALFYQECGNPEKAELFCLTAIEIYERLSYENPECFEPYLANNLNNAGIIYMMQNNSEKAEIYFSDAIEIREKLVLINQERYEPDLAESYINAGSFYSNISRAEKAEHFYLAAIKIYKRLAAKNPEGFEQHLAKSYLNAGVLYQNQRDFKNAEEFYTNAINIYEKLAAEKPEQFEPILARSYYYAGAFYNDQGKSEKANELYLASIKIKEKLAAERPDLFEPDLAMSYWNYALFENNDSYSKKAYEIALNHPDDPICKEIINLFNN